MLGDWTWNAMDWQVIVSTAKAERAYRHIARNQSATADVKKHYTNEANIKARTLRNAAVRAEHYDTKPLYIYD